MGSIYLEARAAKKQLPTGSKAEKVLRAFLPLLPVVLGALLGLIPGMPLPLLERTLATAVLYYAFAGVASTWAFDMVNIGPAVPRRRHRDAATGFRRPHPGYASAWGRRVPSSGGPRRL